MPPQNEVTPSFSVAVSATEVDEAKSREKDTEENKEKELRFK